MSQESVIFDEVLALGLLFILVLICLLFPGAIADREEYENRPEKAKNKEVV